MKKIIVTLAVLGLFTNVFAQEKEGCCTGKNKKECSANDKKANAEYHKGCDKKENMAQNTTKLKDNKIKKAKKS